MTARLIWEDSFETFALAPGHFVESGAAYNAGGDHVALNAVDGKYIERGWGLGPRAPTNDGADAAFVHRCYSITHFDQMVPPAIITGPGLYSLMVWIDSGIHMANRAPGTNDWISTMTVASGPWTRVITTSLGLDGVMKLQHVPNFGEANYIYQNPIQWPRDKWVKQDLYIDFSSTAGYAKLYQDGILTCHALVKGGLDQWTREHGGFYASAALASAGPNASIRNDRKRIYAVDSEADIADLILPMPVIPPTEPISFNILQSISSMLGAIRKGGDQGNGMQGYFFDWNPCNQFDAVKMKPGPNADIYIQHEEPQDEESGNNGGLYDNIFDFRIEIQFVYETPPADPMMSVQRDLMRCNEDLKRFFEAKREALGALGLFDIWRPKDARTSFEYSSDPTRPGKLIHVWRGQYSQSRKEPEHAG